MGALIACCICLVVSDKARSITASEVLERFPKSRDCWVSRLSWSSVFCMARTWSCSWATSRWSSIISLLAPNERGIAARRIQVMPASFIDSSFERGQVWRPVLLAHREMGAPVLLITIFVRVGALRFLLAVADLAQLAGGHAELNQVLTGGIGATVPESEVVFVRATLVAMPFHDDGDIRIVLEDLL